MHFELEWDPLLYYVTIGGARFNWEDIISDNMEDAILRAQEGFFRHLSSSHMYSYLLDSFGAFNPFHVWDGVGNLGTVLLMYVFKFCGPKTHKQLQANM